LPFHGSNRGSNPLGDATPVIEVRGAGFTNKGAHLMLLAVRERLKARYPNAVLTMVPSHSAGPSPFPTVVAAGFMPKCELWRWGVPWGDLARLAPRKIREMFGWVLDLEVDAVLDISGFAYSDQWGRQALTLAASAAKRWRRRGVPLVLLPQAFGPIEDSHNQRSFRRLLGAADLVFSRDADSHAWASRFAPYRERLQQAPDFTNLIAGIRPENPADFASAVAITPNYRMLDKTDPSIRDRYVPFLTKVVSRVSRAGLRPILLIHEGAPDLALAKQVCELSGVGEILVESDPLKLKGVLGCCAAAVGSRYHGLVSALSQGVPALGTSWSHKYRALYGDYEFSSGLIDLKDELETDRQIEALLDPDWRSGISRELASRAEELRRQSEQMWEEVYRVIDRVVL
jgi:polysaccharide pyruvyl transferase WcaK-like protein